LMFPNPGGNRVIHGKRHAASAIRWQISHQQVRPYRVPHRFIEPNTHRLNFSEGRKSNRQLIEQPGEGLVQGQIGGSSRLNTMGFNPAAAIE